MIILGMEVRELAKLILSGLRFAGIECGSTHEIAMNSGSPEKIQAADFIDPIMRLY